MARAHLAAGRRHRGTTGDQVLLVGILDKVGTYGMIRFCLQLFPEASQWATPVVITLAVVSVIYGALLAIGQTDMMRLIAFTSISHFGLIVLGIFALTTVGAGSTLYMVNHGFSTRGCSSSRASSWRGVGPSGSPTTAVADAGARRQLPRRRPVEPSRCRDCPCSCPSSSSWVGTFMRYEAAAVIATIGIVLAALYILLMYQRVMTGPKPSFSEGEAPSDLSLREKAVVVPIIASFLVLGFPKPVLDLLNPAVGLTLQYVGVTDPTPTNASGSAK